MALRTMGTAATTTLSGFLVGTDDYTTSSVALLRAGILNDTTTGTGGVVGPVGVAQIYPGAYAQKGLLYVPNRGVLKLIDGDFVAFDPLTGFPIVVSALAAAAANWVHT